MRLIDADALKEKTTAHGEKIAYTVSFLWDIDDSPTIDAVPVVRCGECKHWRRYGLDVSNRKEYGRCEWIDSTTHTPYEDWFCADGERREATPCP